MEFFYIILGFVMLIAVPWTVIHIISRINEQLNRNKTLRRMNDFVNVYWDYNHRCWVQKSEYVEQQK